MHVNLFFMHIISFSLCNALILDCVLQILYVSNNIMHPNLFRMQCISCKMHVTKCLFMQAKMLSMQVV